jgi:large subunit ribosomal protein L23
MTALFKKKTDDKEKPKEEKKTSPIKPEKKLKAIVKKGDAGLAYKYLIEPWITEKSHDAMAGNIYMFRVNVDSDKKKIKEAVENLYSVSVTKVTIVNIPRKKRVYGRTSGWKAGFKKAMVKLKAGDKIELFKGV